MFCAIIITEQNKSSYLRDTFGNVIPCRRMPEYFLRTKRTKVLLIRRDGILTKEESEFVNSYARTFSVRKAAEAAGFDRRTAFARASLLLERPEAQREIERLILERKEEEEPDGKRGESSIEALAKRLISREEARILREYEKIAFADTSDGEIKVADKLRALEQYRVLAERMKGDGDGEGYLVVNYDYGK